MTCSPAIETLREPQKGSRPSAEEPRDTRPESSKVPEQSKPRSPTTQSGGPAIAPLQPRDAQEYVRREGAGPGRKIEDIRKERREEREGDRITIREGDRTITREGDRTIIRHNESSRFAVGARNVRSERRGANTATVVERDNGIFIISVMTPDGRLARRIRRDQKGRETVIIDNTFRGARGNQPFIQMTAPVIRIPRERYIVEMSRANPTEIYDTFVAEPAVPIRGRFTLEQVRYNAELRDHMPRVDVDINFEPGSWEVSSSQIQRLKVIADGLNRAIAKNPGEVFIVEGHTDAVGSQEDNLSLSDRRAEAIAVVLTEQFQVPPENLVTQGYGESHLKVQTTESEEANRRVAVRRITPLMSERRANR